MNYLIDTNVWLEILLDQNRSVDAQDFLRSKDSTLLKITDFSVYLMGIILNRLKKPEVFEKFVNDVLIQSSVDVIRLSADDLLLISKIIGKYGLDFDDAYHYVAAEKYDLNIVSFDSDFDGTTKGRIIPEP